MKTPASVDAGETLFCFFKTQYRPLSFPLSFPSPVFHQLKHGKYPLEYYLNSMETIIGDLDNEYRKIKDIPQYNSVNNPTKDNSFSLD